MSISEDPQPAQRAIILFGHGARDPQWAQPLKGLQHMLQAQMGVGCTVELAFLELMDPRLPEVTGQLVQGGIKRIDIIPVFFGRGGHLKNDFPVLLAKLQSDFPGVSIHATEAVGQWEAMWQALANEAARRLN